VLSGKAATQIQAALRAGYEAIARGDAHKRYLEAMADLVKAGILIDEALRQAA
jgi:hypothetical protein